MTIEEAFRSHNHIKVQLILFLNDTGKLDRHLACHSDHCALGYWLCQALKKMPQCEFLNKMAKTHAAFHNCASEIVNLSEQGRKQDAIKFAKSDSKLKHLSTKMTNMVKNYKKQNYAVISI